MEAESHSEATGAHRELAACESEAVKGSRLEEDAEGQRLLIRQLEATVRLLVPRAAGMREVEDLAHTRNSLAIAESQCEELRAEAEVAEKRLSASAF